MTSTTFKRHSGAVLHSKLGTTLLLLVYVGALHYTYEILLAPNFGSAGITYRAPEQPSYGITILGVLLISQLLPDRITRVSGFILWALFLTAAAPGALMAQYSQTLSPGDANRLSLVIGMAMMMMAWLAQHNPLPALPNNLGRSSQLWLAIVSVTLLVNVYLLLFVGVQLRYLSFSDVNEVRQSYVATSSSVPLIGYLLASQLNVINPFIIFWGLAKRNALALASGLSSQAIAYLTTGQKHSILLVLVLIGLRYGLGAERFKARTMMLSILLISGLAIIIDQITSSLTWTSLVVRRFLVVPGMLSAAYVAVFENQPNGRFLDVVGSSAGADVDSAARTVGRVFLGSSEASANANLFGHGYYSLGFTGIFIEAAFVVVMLWLADAVTRQRVPLAWACAIFAGPTVALTNSSAFTTFLTHGFATALVVSALVSRESLAGDQRAWDSNASAHGRDESVANRRSPFAGRSAPDRRRRGEGRAEPT